MSVEFAPHPPQEEMLDAMVTAADKGDDAEAASRFWEIVETTLDRFDLQGTRRIDLAKDEIDRMIEPFMKHPVESVRAEFALLGRLYEGRTIEGATPLGTNYAQWVTRRAGTDTIDHHFKVIDFESGTRWLIDEMANPNGKGNPHTLALKDDELSITEHYYSKGKQKQRPLDLETDGAEMLRYFFHDTILAADLMYRRSPEVIDDFNVRGLKLIHQKVTRR